MCFGDAGFIIIISAIKQRYGKYNSQILKNVKIKLWQLIIIRTIVSRLDCSMCARENGAIMTLPPYSRIHAKMYEIFMFYIMARARNILY